MQNSAGFLLWVGFRILAVKTDKVLLAEGGGRVVPLWRNGMILTQNSVSFNDLP